MMHATILIKQHRLTYAYWHNKRLSAYQSWLLTDQIHGLYLYNPTIIGHYIGTCIETYKIPQGIQTWLAFDGDSIEERIEYKDFQLSADYLWHTQKLPCLASDLYYQVGIKPTLIFQYLIFCHTYAINLVHIGTGTTAICQTMAHHGQTVTNMQSLQELIKKHITTYDTGQIETNIPLPPDPTEKKEMVSSYGLYLMAQNYEK